MPEVHVWYHVWAGGDWRRIVTDQLAKLMFSGLYRACAAVHCGVVGPRAEDAIRLIADHGAKFRIMHLSEAEAGERPTLHALLRWAPSQPTDTAVLYLHSKGVTKGAVQAPNVDAWRWAMEWHLVARWRRCVGLLRDADALGCFYADGPLPHFSGNFWWCTAGHAASLPATIEPPDWDLAPEMHVLKKKNHPAAKVACVAMPHPAVGDMYYNAILPRLYVDDDDYDDVDDDDDAGSGSR